MELNPRANEPAKRRGRMRATFLAAVLTAVSLAVPTYASAGTESLDEQIMLEGPNVVEYGMGPYSFEDEGRLLLEGTATETGGCAFEHTLTLNPGETLSGIQIAYDPSRCLTLYATGQLVAGGPEEWLDSERTSSELHLAGSLTGSSSISALAVRRHEAYTWSWVDEPARWALNCDVEDGAAEGCFLPPVNSVRSDVVWFPDGSCAIAPGNTGVVSYETRHLALTGWKRDSNTWQHTPDGACRDTIWSRNYTHFSNELFCELISDPIVNSVPIVGPIYDTLVDYRTETHYEPNAVTGTKAGASTHIYAVSHDGDCDSFLRDGWKMDHT